MAQRTLKKITKILKILVKSPCNKAANRYITSTKKINTWLKHVKSFLMSHILSPIISFCSPCRNSSFLEILIVPKSNKRIHQSFFWRKRERKRESEREREDWNVNFKDIWALGCHHGPIHRLFLWYASPDLYIKFIVSQVTWASLGWAKGRVEGGRFLDPGHHGNRRADG